MSAGPSLPPHEATRASYCDFTDAPHDTTSGVQRLNARSRRPRRRRWLFGLMAKASRIGVEQSVIVLGSLSSRQGEFVAGARLHSASGVVVEVDDVPIDARAAPSGRRRHACRAVRVHRASSFVVAERRRRLCGLVPGGHASLPRDVLWRPVHGPPGASEGGTRLRRASAALASPGSSARQVLPR